MSTIRFIKGNSTREVKAGFSWTVLFFTFIPFMYRGMYGHAAILLIANLLTLGLAGIIVSFFANKMTAHWLIEKGYTTSDMMPEGW